MMTRVAVVTGANKGLGLAIVKGLCEQFDGIVYLTARNEALGQAAVENLKKDGLQPRFHQLDITDDASVEIFKNYLKEKHGGLDVLVNNAGIAFQTNAPEKFPQRVVETLKVNYFGLVRICKALFPLLRPHARVVNVTSSVGHLSKIPGNELRNKLSDPGLTEEGLSQIMRDFIDAAQENTHREAGWPNSSYTVSKVGISALNIIQQKAFDSDDREDIVCNAVHPGSVISDMSTQGTLTPEESAQTPIYLALLPKNTDVKGRYVWFDRSFIDWVHGEVRSYRPDSPNTY